MSALRFDGVGVRYGDVPALRDVTLDVPDGAVLAVLGPSGCGKSTLLRAAAGLEPLSSGRILLDGRDLAGVPTHRRGLALMFQDGQLFGHMSVARNVGYALRVRHAGRAVTAGRVSELLELVGLGGYEDRAPATLSGGERQRAALARALAVSPRVLLLDEPLSALDADLRARLAADLRRILRDAGVTALLVTHDHEEAFAVADRLAVMRDGRVVQEGPIADVWARPADPDTARFLGYARVLTGDAAALVLRAAGAAPDPSAAVALRRSALRVEPGGTLAGTVRTAQAAPDQVRLTVDVDGLGVMDAVAARDAAPAVGERVALGVDASRTARVGAGEI